MRYRIKTDQNGYLTEECPYLKREGVSVKIGSAHEVFRKKSGRKIKKNIKNKKIMNKFETSKKWRKTLPFIPIVGLFLTPKYHIKYGDTGLSNPTILWVSALLQGVYIISLFATLTLI